MRAVNISAGVIAAVSLTVVPASAQHGNSGSHGPSAPKTQTTSHGPSSPHGPSSGGNSGSSHGPSTATHGPSSKSSGDAGTTGAKSPKSTATTSTASDSTSTASNSTSSTATSSSGTTTKVDFTATPVGQKLTKNTALNSKLTTRLQAEGYTGSVYQAAYGFKNLGQFVAATNVSKNLGVSFDQLKLQMTGTKVTADGTVMKAMIGPDGKITLVDPSKTTDPTLSPAPTKSLGQSIQTLKSDVDSTAAAQTATKQADAEIGGATTTTTSR
jgi:hypothetical protein